MKCDSCKRYRLSCTGGISEEACKRIKMPITNYDRLISKTPEELAEWLDNNDSNFPISDGGEYWLSWLKSPAEEGEG